MTTTALVLSRTLPLPKPSPSAALAITQTAPVMVAVRPLYVYGDSTPFSLETNFIETLCDAVDCGVVLMQAEDALNRARARVSAAEKNRQASRAQLLGVSDAVRRSIASENMSHSERVSRVSGRILASARAAIEGELTAVEAETKAQGVLALSQMEAATESVVKAVAKLFAKHDMPNTRIALRMAAREAGYGVDALVKTPFGLDMVFGLEVPKTHAWSRVRKVGELREGTEVRVPQETGFFSKRVETCPVKLDKLLIRALAADADGCVVVMGKGLKGAGCEIEVDARVEPARAHYREIGEDGKVAGGAPFELTGEDRMVALQLVRRVVESTSDLRTRRGAMRSAVLENKPIGDYAPRTLCERMVDVLAPLAREIARRSGARGELVLRRDTAAGRRDEIYVTTAELRDKVETLPTALRTVFVPLGIWDGGVPPRKPHSSFIDIEEADVVET